MSTKPARSGSKSSTSDDGHAEGPEVEVAIPHNWSARPYQRPFFRYMQKGGKRAVIRWHRRGGKDEVCLHWTAIAAHERIGNYWHMLPEQAQARKAVWNAINPHTMRRRIDDAFPPAIRRRTLEQEMLIEFHCGSTWQLVGSDRFDSLVGAPPVGLVFSEYALSNPLAWDYLRPMLAENGGWAVFNSTVRGRNHFWKLGEFARSDPDWFFSEQNADQTGVFTPATLAAELRELVALWGEDDGRARFRQEYYNDPTVAMPGAYYAALLAAAELDGRIGRFKYDPSRLVHTAWDLGQDNETAIWMWQDTPKGPVFLAYLHARNKSMAWYAAELRKTGWRLGRVIFPHDIRVHEWSGKTRLEVAAEEGLVGEVAPAIGVADGIEAVRRMLPTARFDAEGCAAGLDALSSYHSELDEDRRTLALKPVGDWSSHGADAMRMMAVSVDAGLYATAAREEDGADKWSWRRS